jgi:hypothetical protein
MEHKSIEYPVKDFLYRRGFVLNEDYRHDSSGMALLRESPRGRMHVLVYYNPESWSLYLHEKRLARGLGKGSLILALLENDLYQFCGGICENLIRLRTS